MCGMLIYLFLKWVISSHETEIITLVTINLFFFPFSRIFVHTIKDFFFSNTTVMFTEKMWLMYQLVRFVVLGWIYMMTPIFAPIGFMIVLFCFWRAQRVKEKYMQQSRQSFARS
ncbi:hypothetical protein AZF08_09610 [Bacillus gaemokensis]|nr:hypothetical protein AZF08_09610 [Bacillus gaemokensis]